MISALSARCCSPCTSPRRTAPPTPWRCADRDLTPTGVHGWCYACCTRPSWGSRAAGWSSATGCSGRAATSPAIGKALADDHRVTLVDMPDHGQSPWSDRFDYLAAADQVAELLVDAGRPRRAGRPLDGRQDLDAGRAAPPRAGRAARASWTSSPVPYDHAAEFERLHRGDARHRPRQPGSARRGRRGAARGGAGPDGARLPAAEPAPRGRRLALAPQPRAARPRPRRHHRLARGRRWPAPRRTTGRCCGSAAPTRDYVAPRVRRGDGPLVPPQPSGHRQGRRPLGAQRAARGLRRGAAQVPG